MRMNGDLREGGRAIGYVRVSTREQADTGASLQTQEVKIRAMAAVQDAELLDIIVDAGESAKTLNRPGMAQLLARVESREVQIVIVAKLDRLTRSVRDLANLLEKFDRRRVVLVSVTESLDTATAGGRLVLNIMSSVSQWEREAISERTRDVLRHKKANGFRTGEILYGYKLAADGRRLEADDREQRTLSRLRELRASGLSCREVAEHLNAEGYTTRRGSPWRFQYVAELARRTPEQNRAF